MSMGSDSHVSYQHIPHPRSRDGKTCDQPSATSAGFSVPQTTLTEAIHKGSDTIVAFSDSPSSVSHAPSSTVVEVDEINASSASGHTAIPRGKKKRPAIESSAKKPCTDGYSKRSQTLLKKGKELEKLTGAYVVIYAARPETTGVGNSTPCLFTSQKLLTTDSDISMRISGATDEINAAAIELAHTSRAAAKRARTNANNETFLNAEQDAGSIAKSNAHPDTRGKDKYELAGNPLCTAGLESSSEKHSRETAIAEAGSNHFQTLGGVVAEIQVSQAAIQDALKDLAFYYQNRCTCSQLSSLTSFKQQSPKIQAIVTHPIAAPPDDHVAESERNVQSSSEGSDPSLFLLDGCLAPATNTIVAPQSQDSIAVDYCNPARELSQEVHAQCWVNSQPGPHQNALDFSASDQPPMLSTVSSVGTSSSQSKTSLAQHHTDDGQSQRSLFNHHQGTHFKAEDTPRRPSQSTPSSANAQPADMPIPALSAEDFLPAILNDNLFRNETIDVGTDQNDLSSLFDFHIDVLPVLPNESHQSVPSPRRISGEPGALFLSSSDPLLTADCFPSSILLTPEGESSWMRFRETTTPYEDRGSHSSSSMHDNVEHVKNASRGRSHHRSGSSPPPCRGYLRPDEIREISPGSIKSRDMSLPCDISANPRHRHPKIPGGIASPAMGYNSYGAAGVPGMGSSGLSVPAGRFSGPLNSGEERTMMPENTVHQFGGQASVVKHRVASDAIVTASRGRRMKEARFTCSVAGCSATFTANHNLKNHLNSHSGVKDFKCEACGAQFTTAGVLARHIKNTHPP